MKKMIVIIMLLCLCIGICACGSASDISEETQQNSEQNNQEITGDVVMPSGGERPLLTFESIELYQKFLNQSRLPENFVRYEKISQLGSFVNLVFLSDASAGDFSSYMYSLVDDSDYEITLYVNSNMTADNESTNNIDISSINSNDMRQLSGASSGKYAQGELVYKYVSGKLLSIAWNSEGISYKLCGSSMLSDYPSTSSTVVGQLLNSNNASAALQSVFNAVDE